jgi:hypothetical protein
MMKFFCCCFLLLMGIHFFAAAQSANDVISTLRMGPFKLRTAKTDIEKTIGQKLQSYGKEYFDTADVNYGGVKYTLVFNQEYSEDPKKVAPWKLYGVSSVLTGLKTKSLIGIGSTKAEILQAYDKFDITIYNDYDYKTKGNAKDKIQFITLKDFDADTQITFTTENRIVKKIEVAFYEGD